MRISKEYLPFVKQNTILAVEIPYKVSKQQSYIGTGRVKKTELIKNSKFYEVTLQIDIIYPLDPKFRQEVPQKKVKFSDYLSFRVRYDVSSFLRMITEIDTAKDFDEGSPQDKIR